MAGHLTLRLKKHKLRLGDPQTIHVGWIANVSDHFRHLKWRNPQRLYMDTAYVKEKHTPNNHDDLGKLTF